MIGKHSRLRLKLARVGALGSLRIAGVLALSACGDVPARAPLSDDASVEFAADGGRQDDSNESAESAGTLRDPAEASRLSERSTEQSNAATFSAQAATSRSVSRVANTGRKSEPQSLGAPSEPNGACGSACEQDSELQFEPSAASGTPAVKSVLASATGAASPQSYDDSDFWLSRRGRQLWYGGRPYRAIGVNAFGMAGCETGNAYSDAQMDTFFGSLRPLGLTRAWAFAAQGIFGLQRMVRWAERHSQLLILSLADGRGYCGESDGRNGAEGSGKNENWYKYGYKQRYLPWLKIVVESFKNSHGIGMWELINEPGDTDDQTMRAFFDDAAATIKAIDHHHLVLSGSQAEYVRGTSDYKYVHGGPDIDVASLHEYDYDYNNSQTIVSPHLAPTLAAMRELDKPLIVSEMGIQAGSGADCTSYASRRDAARLKFDEYLRQDGVVGVVVWSWVPNERNGCTYESFAADPLMPMIRTYR